LLSGLGSFSYLIRLTKYLFNEVNTRKPDAKATARDWGNISFDHALWNWFLGLKIGQEAAPAHLASDYLPLKSAARH